ncbi:EamA family transporter [Neisseria gonorrhoeae]|nr:EamA family transporter [Neisseria gonorrhoeae]MBT8029704.1 EamA family transporter [Neisseria gonorrhoeae]MCF3065938.1 EamA family transporter [Neisseria gonorrhoeae]MCH8710909.1 EamA family transporter [Neisseria gonorrhoeae]ROU95373.1 EamA/RhaT family transporter [Neisseria gonorrhoeae]TJW90195.1 EamA/RhaT family transporter [Neisseria gonorrhoeae]
MFYQILALIIWGSSFIAAKYVYGGIDPALMVGVRLLIAALPALPACRRHVGKIPREEWKPLLIVSFVNYVLTLLLQFVGLKYTSAASASVIVGLEPLLMVFAGHFFFNDKARAYHWICGAAAFAGVALLMAGGAEEGGEVGWFGCLLVLLAGAGFCAAMRPTQRLIARIGAPAFTSVSIAAASLMCLPFSLALAQSYTVDWSVGMVLSLLYLGLGCGWYAYWLWNKGMSRVPANASGLLISLEPVVGVLLAVLILGEHLSPVSALGVFVVIAATFAAGRLSRRDAQNGNAV